MGCEEPPERHHLLPLQPERFVETERFLIVLAGLWCWFAEDHELIEEMRRGRQAEGPNAAARRRGGLS